MLVSVLATPAHAATTMVGVSVSADGRTLVFDAADSINSSSNMPGGITVTINGVAVTVGSPSSFINVGGQNNYYFTLGRTVLPSDVVLVTYAPTASVYLSTPNGQLPAFTNMQATNNSTQAPDTTAPTLTGATLSANGLSLVLAFSENVHSASALLAAYTVSVNGSPVTLTGTPTISTNTITLTLSTAVWASKTVTASYTAPTIDSANTNAAIQDASGNDTLSIANYAVTNNSTQGPDLTAPALSGTPSVTYSGTTVSIAFSETLATSPSLSPSNFKVFVGGVLVNPTAATVSGTNVQLSLPSAPATGTEVIVSYTAPAKDGTTANAAIQDTSGNDANSFNATSKTVSTNWAWAPTPAYDATAMAVNGCDGSGSTNRIKQTTLANGTIMGVGVTGAYVCINDATESLSARGGAAGDFVSNALVTEPGLKLTTSNINCGFTTTCSRGQITFYFSQAVTNPIISFAGWGGGTGSTTAWSELELATANTTMTVLSGTNIQTTNNGTYLAPIVKDPSINCHTNSGYGATAQAGCGSVSINGTFTQVSFNVFMGTENGTGWLDAWNLNVNIQEDFGLAPGTYDSPAGSHVIDGLTLGSTVAADMGSSLYGNTSPDAVARWTSLANNAKKDDGVADWGSSPIINFTPGGTYSTTMAVTNVTKTAYLCSWIDFNRDEVFAYDERSCATVQSGSTSVALTWNVPLVLGSGLTYARARLSYDQVIIPTGKLGSGEIEDYSLTIPSQTVPYASADNSINNKGVTQSISILTNDVLADPATQTWIASSIRLCGSTEISPNCSQTTVTTTDGTYTVNTSTGVVSYAPNANFTGTAAPVSYQVTDSVGNTRTSTINPVVRDVPIATPNTTSGPINTAQSVNLLANDSASTGGTLTASSVKLCAANETAPNCTQASVTVANVGTYSVNSSGVITFTPVNNYVGTPSALPYIVADSTNQVASASYTPTVYGSAAPVSDTSSGPYNTAQTKTVTTNDVAAAGTTLVTNSVRLCSPSDIAPNCTATTLTVANEGTYTVNTSNGAITFTPLATFTGTATPVTYSVTDSAGQKATTTYTPAVGAPPLPVASPEAQSSLNDVNQTYNPLSNDSAGAASFPLVSSTLKLCDPTINPAQTSPNCTVTSSVTVPNVGTYTISGSTVIFDPLPTFSGAAPAFNYQVTDSLGRVVTSTITPTVSPLPDLNPDTSSGPFNTAQTYSVLTNDVAGAGTTLLANSVKLCSTSDTAPNCSQTSVTTADGIYSVSSSGVITFTPTSTFVGTATSITYSTTDSLGQKAYTTYTPTVSAPSVPIASPDYSSGTNDANQAINVLANDSAGSVNVPLDPSTVRLCGTSETSPNCTLTTFTVPGEGTYTVDPLTGVVTFDPLPSFSGHATPISYQVSDTLLPTARTVTSTVNPTVSPLPVPVADTSSGPYNTAQTGSVLANDVAGDGAMLSVGSVKLCNSTDTAPNCTATSVTIANQGTYTVNSSGVVTFTPLPNFTGTASPVTYSVTDSLGQKVSTTYTPTVGAPPLPIASPNTSIDAHDVNQVFNPFSNDTAGSASFPLDPTTVKLCAVGSSTNCALTSLTVAGVGVYTVNQTTGAVTFNPESAFDGTAPAITYSVSDSLSRAAYSTITPTVVPLPVALNDTPSPVPYGTSQTITPLDNDSAATGYILVSSTLKFCGVNPAQTPNSCTLTSGTITTVDGTYTINGTSIVFTPAVNFTGTVTQPIRYQVADSLGQISTAVITPSVLPPTPATVTPNSSSNNWDVNQPISPLNNDTPTQNASWTISTLKLCSSAQASPNCTQTSVTVANQGTYTIDTATAAVTFDPLPTFVGTASPVSYQITDSYGATLSSTITPTVVAAAPVASSQTVTVLPTQNATFSAITGVTGLASQGSASLSTICLITSGSNPATCDADGIVNVANQGTYTLDSAAGVVTFVPVAGLVGGTALTPITYKVTDQVGLTATASLTVITPPPPVANPNVSFGAYETPQTISPLGNDVAGSLSAPLVASTVKFCATGQTGLACNATSVTTAEGTYTVGTNGIVTFTPVAGYSGQDLNGVIQPVAHPVTYVVQDTLGQVATSSITPTVFPQPATAAIPDSGSAAWTTTVTVTINPLTNDSKGAPPQAFVTVGTLALDPATVHFCAPTESAPNCTLNTITTVDGTYTIASNTGVVTFDPVITFTGTVTVVPIYQICNSVSGTWTITGNTSATPNSTCATSTITPTITPPPAPIATPNTTSGIIGATQTSNLLTNDFLNGVPVDSVHLCAVGQTAPNCTANTLTVANVGTYTVNTETGVITFTPLPTYVGTPPTVKYVVKDILGALADSTYTPTVTPLIGPTATPETRTTTIGTPVNFSNITGVAGLAAQGTGSITPARTCLVDPANASICSSSVITADGIWSLDASTGIATYTPNADTPLGTKIVVTYKVTDVNGMSATSNLTPIIVEAIAIQSPPPSSGGSSPISPVTPVTPTKPLTPKPLPRALPDVKSGKLNQVINITPVLNDVQADAPLVPTTIVLCTLNCKTVAENPAVPKAPDAPTEPAQPIAPQPIVTTQGTWTVNADSGRVQFTPVKNWFGIAIINYVMFDADGNSVISKITVTIPKPVLPKTLSYTGDAKTLVPKIHKAALQTGTYVATMVAPRLGAKWIKKVYEGTSLSKVLTPLGLGHYSETQMPGQVGNFAVAAHRFGSGGPFLNVDKFRTGDLVYVSSGTAKYTYRYLQTKVVKPSAVEVLLPVPGGMTAGTETKSFMTLQTCTPVHINTHRLIVWFELINSELS